MARDRQLPHRRPARHLALARRRYAHSVHVEVSGLSPATEYWYRFRAAPHLSPDGPYEDDPRGRRDAPRASGSPLASCQNYQQGYWPAYTAMAAEDHSTSSSTSGTTIYEYRPERARSPGRRHTRPADAAASDQLCTLTDYRRPARPVQGSTRPCRPPTPRRPGSAVWDDHEGREQLRGLADDLADTGAHRQTPRCSRPSGLPPTRPTGSTCRCVPGRCSATPAYRAYRGARLRRPCCGSACSTPGSTAPSSPERLRRGLRRRGGRPGEHGGDADRCGPGGVAAGPARSRGARWNVVAQQTMMMRTRWPDVVRRAWRCRTCRTSTSGTATPRSGRRLLRRFVHRPDRQPGRALGGRPLDVVQRPRRGPGRPRRPGRRLASSSRRAISSRLPARRSTRPR